VIFAGASQRTRTSFEAGIAEMGGHPMVLRPASRSSAAANRSVTRLGYPMSSRNAAAIGIRTGPDEDVEELARHASVPVINMLTARHHPCQARRPAHPARGVRIG
jgi:ornithine carbamoyltransferase